MPYKLNEKLQYISPYEIKDEYYKLRLDANESFIDWDLQLKDKILAALQDIHLNRYPDDSCLPLRRAFADCYKVDPERVVAGNGSDELIALLIGSFLKREEKMMMFSPEFSMYRIFAETFEKDCIIMKKNKDYTVDIAEVIREINKEGISALFFSNPASPAANVILRKEIISILEQTNALIVVDEAYMDFSNQSVLDLTDKYDNLVVLKTCSKALGCASIRLGFAVSSKEIADVLNALRPPYNINSFTQTVGRLILSDTDYKSRCVDMIIESRNHLYQQLLQLAEETEIGKVYPSETNYIYIETDQACSIWEELKRRSILVRCLEKGLRITAGTKEDNFILIKALNEIMNM